jgi:hypothetical protein
MIHGGCWCRRHFAAVVDRVKLERAVRHTQLPFLLPSSPLSMGLLTYYYTLGAPASLVTLVALYLLFTGPHACSAEPRSPADMTTGAQGLARRSMSAGSSRRRVRIHGLGRVLDFASV